MESYNLTAHLRVSVSEVLFNTGRADRPGTPAPPVQTNRTGAELHYSGGPLACRSLPLKLHSPLFSSGVVHVSCGERTAQSESCCSSNTVTGGNIHTGLPGLYHIYNHIHTVPPGSYYNCIYIAADAGLSHFAGAWRR